MMKKLITCTCVLVILGGSASVTYANPTTRNIDTSRLEAAKAAQSVQIITPERDSTISTTNLVLELTAPKDTKIKVLVYYNASLVMERENFVLAQEQPVIFEIGALQRAWIELELKRGTNKIDVVAVYKDGSTETVTRLINVKGVEEVKTYLENTIKSTSASQLIKDITGRK